MIYTTQEATNLRTISIMIIIKYSFLCRYEFLTASMLCHVFRQHWRGGGRLPACSPRPLSKGTLRCRKGRAVFIPCPGEAARVDTRSNFRQMPRYETTVASMSIEKETPVKRVTNFRQNPNTIVRECVVVYHLSICVVVFTSQIQLKKMIV